MVSDMPEMPEIPNSKSPKHRRMVMIISGIFLLLALAAVFMYLNKPQSLWAPTTMEYGDCGDDCIDLGVHHFSHAGDLQFYYDKDVDDAVVQWGACLDSAISCIKAGPKEDTGRISRCVAASSCPNPVRRTMPVGSSLKPALKTSWPLFKGCFSRRGPCVVRQSENSRPHWRYLSTVAVFYGVGGIGL